MKNNSYTTGSAHQRVYANLPFTEGVKKGMGDNLPTKGLSIATLPADLGVNIWQGLKPIEKIKNTTKWGFIRVLGGVDRVGGFMWEGTARQFVRPILETSASVANSLKNWVGGLPKDIASTLPTVGKGVGGVGLNVAAVPFKVAGWLPSKLLGWNTVYNWGNNMDKMGDGYRSGFFTPTQNTINTGLNIAGAGIAGTINSVRANFRAWSNLIFGGSKNSDIDSVTQEVQVGCAGLLGQQAPQAA